MIIQSDWEKETNERDDDETERGPKGGCLPRNPPGDFFPLARNDFRVEDQNGKTRLCTT